MNDSHESLDAGSAYFERAGVTQRFRHPRTGGDECTFVQLDADWVDATTNAGLLPVHSVTITPTIALWHRAVTSSAASEDPTGRGAEFMMRLVMATVRRVTERPHHKVERPSHHRLAHAARDLLLNTPAGEATLAHAAHDLGVSPWPLSRSFAAVHGATFSEFRNTLRIQEAISRLAMGETDLARLARDLGFSDHPHLTRTLRTYLDAAPRQIRCLLLKARND